MPDISEEQQLNTELKKLQRRAKRLILNNYYDSINLSDTQYSILEKLTNAETHKDISNYLWNSGAIERVLDFIQDKIKRLRKDGADNS